MEVLIAMSIFAIGVLGVAKMQIQSTTGNSSARKVTEASEFAQAQLELSMATTYTNLALGTTQTFSNGYTITRNVSNAQDSGGTAIAGIREIIVTVTDPQGKERASLRITKTANM